MNKKEKYPLRGVVISLDTPFDSRGRVDLASLERCVEFHIQEGAVGFLAAAQASEVYTLKTSERMQILQCVRAATLGKVELFASATSKEDRERFMVAERATQMGCDGVLVEVPEELKKNSGAILEFFRDFAKVGMRTLMIQDLSWYGAGMPLPLIAQLFDEIQPFRCLKVETVPSCPKYTAIHTMTGGLLHISGGWASLQLLEALDRGIDAIMPTGMTRWYRRIFDAHGRGERDEARKLYQKLLPVLAFTQQHLDISIQFHKRFSYHRGIFSTTKVRAPSIMYDEVHEKCAEELIRYIDSLDDWETPAPRLN